MCYFLDGIRSDTVGICVIFSTGFVLTPLVCTCYFLDGIHSDTVGICVIFSTGFVLTPLIYVLFSRRDSC